MSSDVSFEGDIHDNLEGKGGVYVTEYVLR